MVLAGALVLCSVVSAVFTAQLGNNDQTTLTELMSWLPEISQVLEYNGSSSGCVNQSSQLLLRAQNLDISALHILDSWAKFPSGVLSGNINQFGDYDQCVTAGGRYCLATLDLQLLPVLSHLDTRLHAHYAMTSSIHDPGHRLPKFSLIHWGTCIPSECSSQDLEQALTHAFSNNRKLRVSVRVDPDLCHWSGDPPLAPQVPKILAWIFFMFVSLLCLFGTSVEYFRKNIPGFQQGNLVKIVEAFSVRRNVNGLLDTSGREDIASLHGIRAINALALLLSHKQMALLFLPFINRTQLAQLIGRSWSMLGRSAILYTDSFILLSGLLSCHSLLRELSCSQRINLVDNIRSRFIRLTPSLAALILFCTFLLPDFGSGPLWGLLVNKYASLCQHHWWRNILYIHNHFPFDQMCLTHSHQVAIDSQLFLAAPFLVYPIWRRPTIGLFLLLMVSIWSSVLRYSAALAHHLSTVIYFGVPISQLFRTAELTYILPSHRATVYCLGIALGYFLHRHSTCSISKIFVGVGWVMGVLCGLVSMFGPFHMSWMSYVYSPQEAALYNMLAPLLWSIFVAWVIFASFYGYAGWFGRFLGWKWFAVFTKLSYAVYLTQFPIFFYNVGQVRTSQQYSFFKLVDLAEFVCVFIASTILTLMFDLPAQNLKKILLSSYKGKEQPLTKGEYNGKSEEKQKKRRSRLQRRKRLPG